MFGRQAVLEGINNSEMAFLQGAFAAPLCSSLGPGLNEAAGRLLTHGIPLVVCCSRTQSGGRWAIQWRVDEFHILAQKYAMSASSRHAANTSEISLISLLSKYLELS